MTASSLCPPVELSSSSKCWVQFTGVQVGNMEKRQTRPQAGLTRKHHTKYIKIANHSRIDTAMSGGRLLSVN